MHLPVRTLRHTAPKRRAICALAALLPAAGVCAAAAPPDYDFTWATIGDPGNRDVNEQEGPYLYQGSVGPIGGVDYEFRMATTEVTIGQWFEFVQAYAPYYEGSKFNSLIFTGSHIEYDFFNGSWHINMKEINGEVTRPANMGWEYAARYANWLHNGKAADQAAFESGAYDTSTFTENPDGTKNHQTAHSPGASFWIPTLDEWTKAVYWDPAKNNGEGGYWYQPGASDEGLISGPPGVGQTNAGKEGGGPLPVGSYPDVTTPWGLLDASGGFDEWTSTLKNEFTFSMSVRGSDEGDIAFNELGDALDMVGLSPIWGIGTGLRMASAVPPAPICGILAASVPWVIQRRRAFR